MAARCGFWSTETTYQGCSTAPDGLTHAYKYTVRKCRLWRETFEAIEIGGQGPCDPIAPPPPPPSGNDGYIKVVRYVKFSSDSV